MIDNMEIDGINGIDKTEEGLLFDLTRGVPQIYSSILVIYFIWSALFPIHRQSASNKAS